MSGPEHQTQDFGHVDSDPEASDPIWSPADVEFAKQLCIDGESFWKQFRITRQLRDLDLAAENYRQALSWTIKANQWILFSVLGDICRDRYRASDTLADVEMSIDYYRKALHGVPKISNYHAIVLHGLGAAYKDASLRTRALDTLESSIAHYEELLQFLPADKAEYVPSLRGLAVVYSHKYKWTDSVSDLDRAEYYGRQAYEATPVNDGILRATDLGNIGGTLILRFNRTLQMRDLEEAIQHLRKATDDLPSNDEAYRPMLSRLGDCFGLLFQWTNQIKDLRMCIRCNQQALEVTPTGHPDYVQLSATLGSCSVSNFTRTFQIADIYKGIQYFEQAAGALPVSHPERFNYIAQLGLCFILLFQSTKDTYHLKKSIDLLTRNLESTSADHTHYRMILLHLALGYLTKFRQYGESEDAEKVVEFSQRGLDVTPENHPYRTLSLWTLGSGLASLSRAEASPERLNCSVKAFQDAASCSAGYPNIRIFAAAEAVNILIEEDLLSVAANTLDQFFELLPNIIPPQKSRDDLQYVLGLLSGIGSLAASVYLKIGKSPVYALQALEKARGVISNILIDTRSDVSILKENHPDLWSRYTDCQKQIATLDLETTLGVQGAFEQDYALKSSERKRLYGNLEALRAEIRRCPGLERFLLSLSEGEIRALAQKGPVICLNVNKISSEAFLITKKDIDVIILPSLKEKNIQRQVRLFASRGNPARRNADLEEEDDHDETDSSVDLLSELQSMWDSAVEPVFRHLGITAHVGSLNSLPRIWWVGGGVMALAPLHAAGNHSSGSLQNTLSHAVSSYAPTLRSIQFGQIRSRFSSRREPPNILIVSMPTTPGPYKQLDVAPEVASIVKHSTSATSLQHLERPSREEVLNALESCTIAHFACHGRVDGTEPANSALILGKDSEERLTVADFDASVYGKAKIAYLSACSTAEIQQLDLVDEGIHLASTFLHAGFQHVIGTLWGADDSAAMEVGGQFYMNLARRGEDSDGSVARALHDAVVSFRNKSSMHLAISKWAPFVHLGS